MILSFISLYYFFKIINSSAKYPIKCLVGERGLKEFYLHPLTIYRPLSGRKFDPLLIHSFRSEKKFINLIELYRQHNIPMTGFGDSGNKNTYIFR